MRLRYWTVLALAAAHLVACTPPDTSPPQEEIAVVEEPMGKPVVYQVFTRLFGNTGTTNKPWGTIEENGVGKFNDFTDRALEAYTKALEINPKFPAALAFHLWLTQTILKKRSWESESLAVDIGVRT